MKKKLSFYSWLLFAIGFNPYSLYERHSFGMIRDSFQNDELFSLREMYCFYESRINSERPEAAEIHFSKPPVTCKLWQTFSRIQWARTLGKIDQWHLREVFQKGLWRNFFTLLHYQFNFVNDFIIFHKFLSKFFNISETKPTNFFFFIEI